MTPKKLDLKKTDLVKDYFQECLRINQIEIGNLFSEFSGNGQQIMEN